jgi:hypothetical protein
VGYRVPACASLVAGTIEGDAAEQSWDNVGRALAAMSGRGRPGRAVVLCTDLSERLGRVSMRRRCEDLEQVEQRMTTPVR